MLKTDRQEQIMQILRLGKTATLADLAERLGCSMMTIRRDLNELSDKGEVERVHGGVVYNKQEKEENYGKTAVENMELKRMIAKRAVTYIKENMCVFFDPGYTTYSIADMLPYNIHMTGITSSITTAQRLGRYPNVNVFLLGGELHKSTNSTINRFALDMANSFDADLAFISTSAVDIGRGIMETQIPLIDVKKIYSDRAKKTILVADSTKFDNTAICLCLPMSKVDLVVTDSGVSRNDIEALKKMNIVCDVV